MANRLSHKLEVPERNRRLICGSWETDGANPPINVRGEGFSVARSGVGVFVVTLQNLYTALDASEACLQLGVAADAYVQVGTYDATARTLVIRIVVAGAEADIGAGNRVNFQLMMKN